MKTKYVFILVVTIMALVSCKNAKKPMSEQNQMKQEIADKEKELFSTDETDPKLADEMIKKYVDYVAKYPEDAISPEYLFKAADIAMNFERPHDAIAYLSKIERDYEGFDKYATCLFLKGYVYDYYIGDVEKAKEYYNLLIKKFPNNARVKDAEAALKYLEIDDDDLIELFNSMNDTVK
jgi:tetratricopeptide (TPR) repeat protein